jgi:hypothetical protein
MGLVLKKRMLEDQLKNLEVKLGEQQTGRRGRKSGRSRTSRAETRGKAGKQLFGDALEPPGMGMGMGLSMSSMKLKSPPQRPPGGFDRPATVAAAIPTENTRMARELHKRNTELLVRQRARVKKAGTKLPSLSPSKAGAFKKHKIPSSLFPTAYKRGELPCTIQHRSGGNVVLWQIPFEEVDYEHVMPLFWHGLREQEFPYQFLARQVS